MATLAERGQIPVGAVRLVADRTWRYTTRSTDNPLARSALLNASIANDMPVLIQRDLTDFLRTRITTGSFQHAGIPIQVDLYGRTLRNFLVPFLDDISNQFISHLAGSLERAMQSTPVVTAGEAGTVIEPGIALA